MRELTVSINVAAPVQRVCGGLVDLERWPEWTASVLSIEPIDAEPLGVGSRVRIHQPSLRCATWKVTEWQPHREFVWVAESPGVTVIAKHSVTSLPDGCRVVLSVRFTGLLGSLAGRLGSRLTTRYLGFEAMGLEARSEWQK